MSEARSETRIPIERGESIFQPAAAALGESFARTGTLGVLLVDGRALERIERCYGAAAHREIRERLLRLLHAFADPDLIAADVVVEGTTSPDELAICFLRPRAESAFYRDRLPAMCADLRDRIASEGQKLVYPYAREVPRLAVGNAVIFHDPSLSIERQILAAFDRARADAALEALIARRERHKMFEDLVLSEDVAVLYEPIVNLTTREVLGHEALVRGPWKGELHSPHRLFQLAEETGLVFELDCLCRRIALRGARGLEAGRKLFLNCLPTAIHDPAFREGVLERTLEDLRLRPEDIVFEISERESIENFAIFREARDHLKELGFQVALDDTGVAYGSLEAVIELAPDYIKVDLSLIRGIDTDPPRQELLRALHAVAGKLGGQIIAEGIETSEELSTLQRLGVPHGQGYLFGRAAPLRRAR